MARASGTKPKYIDGFAPLTMTCGGRDDLGGFADSTLARLKRQELTNILSQQLWEALIQI